MLDRRIAGQLRADLRNGLAHRQALAEQDPVGALERLRGLAAEAPALDARILAPVFLDSCLPWPLPYPLWFVLTKNNSVRSYCVLSFKWN